MSFCRLLVAAQDLVGELNFLRRAEKARHYDQLLYAWLLLRHVRNVDFTFAALIDCFKSFDTNGDGHIDIDEFPEALSFVGVQVSEGDLSDLLSLFDTAGVVTCLQH